MVEAAPMDVWLMIPEDYGIPDDEASHEANTYQDESGYRVDWYNTSVGLVSSEWFDTYDDAREWLTEAGYQDFTG